jgi:TPR repeat protein
MAVKTPPLRAQAPGHSVATANHGAERHQWLYFHIRYSIKSLDERIKMLRFAIYLTLAATGAFAQANDSATIRICHASGCSARPKTSSTFQLAAQDPVTAQRTAALVELAQKDPRAAWDLGLRYFRGDGVRQDAYQALQWMRDAGARGQVEAQLALGRFYLMGLEEMGADPAEAETWLSMAAAQGNKDAKKLLAQAREAAKNEQDLYQWRETNRKSWTAYWVNGYPYYTSWGPGGWVYR